MKLYYFRNLCLNNTVSFQDPILYIKYDAENSSIAIEHYIDIEQITSIDFPSTGCKTTIGGVEACPRALLKMYSSGYFIRSLYIDWKSISEDIDMYDLRQYWGVYSALGYIKGPIPYYRRFNSLKKLSSFIANGLLGAEIMSITPSPFSSLLENCLLTVVASDLVLEGDPIELIENPDIITPELLRESVFPQVELTSEGELTKTNPIMINVKVLDCNGNMFPREAELFFEAVNGRISHTRRKTVNGETSIRLIASDLDNGDTARVKVGFKYFSGANDISFVVKEG